MSDPTDLPSDVLYVQEDPLLGKYQRGAQELTSKFAGSSDDAHQDPVYRAVARLLVVWNQIEGSLTETQSSQVDLIVSTIRHGRSLDNIQIGAPPAAETAHRWAPASQYHPYSNIARVRTDYVPGADGWKWNGRLGTIVGKRSGDLIVEFNDQISGAPDSLRTRPAAFEVDISHIPNTRKN